MKKILSGLSKEELYQTAETELNLKKYVGEQIHSWIYAKSSDNIDEWSNLSAKIRETLKENYDISNLKLIEKLVDKKDASQKFLFELKDHELIEAVLMRFRDRESLSACVSSQVGCKVGCTFCGTGKLQFKRNLHYSEIVDQVMSIQRINKEKINNLLYMGQGEPLFNFDNVIESINIFRESVGIGSRNITVSTCGLIPEILKLGRKKLQINLAISLHTAEQDKREKLVPIAKKYNLYDLKKALEKYYENTHRRITFEIILLKGITDTRESAWHLCDFLRDLDFPCLVNLIPYNPAVEGFKRSDRKTVDFFKEIVERSGRKVTIRLSRGENITGACGQLVNFANR